MAKAAICVWDFTIPEDRVDVEDLRGLLEEHCKKFCFQLEEGESGYRHYQGRVSLKVKNRYGPKLNCGEHWSVTSNENRDNDFYVIKMDTRIGGPWSNKDNYIPKQSRDITLFPWQVTIAEDTKFNTRTINVIVCEKGCIGKTTLATYLGCRGLARNVPILESYKDFMRFCMDVPTSRLYLIDFPRSLNKSGCGSMWSAVESIKNGFAWDDRYSYREKYFDCPNIWVFSNQVPDMSMLSEDRWKLWEVRNKVLIPYGEADESECG